jgi:hypothetical protein
MAGPRVQPVAFDIDVPQPFSLRVDAEFPRAWEFPLEIERAKQYVGSGKACAIEWSRLLPST